MFEQLKQKKKLERAKAMFIDTLNKDTKWQNEARDDFGFRDGPGQWTDEEKQILQEELRPVLTFNLTKSSIDLIMGMNEDNRVVHKASPTEPTDAFLCELLNDLSDFVQESQDFEEEEDGALESASICGRGFVGIDFRPDPNRFGDIEMSEIDIPIHEVHFDQASRRPNKEDASFVVWDRWMTREDFKIRFPKIGPKKIDTLLEGQNTWTGTSDPISEDGIPISDSPSVDYEREMDNDINFYDRQRNMLRVVHMEYWENYKRYYIFNPENGKFEEIPKMPTREQKAEFIIQFGEEMTIETMYDKRVKWFQFIANDILFDGPSPMPYPGFSIVPMTAYRDVSKRSNNDFGLVRLMKDPQREVNKRWSQALNMLNQQVQPGVYAETDTFVDETQALQSMKVAGDITWVNAGALSGGKLKERTVPTFPNAPMQMEQFSQDIMKKITGINPDLLGQDRGRQEPGVVVRLRQQQGITLLKPLFRNFNQMKKGLFKRQLAIIMAYMPDAQILRVLGQNERYNIDENGLIIDTTSAIEEQNPETGEVEIVGYSLQANIRDVRSLDYNVKAEQAPGNMTKRMMELQAMMEMQERLPIPPEMIIEKMDVSASEKQRWLKYIEEQQTGEAEQQKEMEQVQIQFEDRKIKVDEQANEQDFLLGVAKIKQASEKDEKSMKTKYAQMDQQEKASLMQFATQVMQAELDERAAEQEILIEATKARQELTQDGQEHKQDLSQDSSKHKQDMFQDDSKHKQDMQFISEKNEIALKGAEDKQKQDLKFAKQKAKEGGDSGQGKQSSNAKN